MNFTGYSDAPAGSDKGRGLTLTRRSFLTAIAALAPFRPALAETAPLPVVASFSILGDLVKEVGGAAVGAVAIPLPERGLRDEARTDGNVAQLERSKDWSLRGHAVDSPRCGSQLQEGF